MLSTKVDVAEAAEGVRLFNLRYGDMEKAAWCLSRASQPELLSKTVGPVLPELVWTVKKWMKVQYVSPSVKTIAPQVLVEFDWTPDLFDDTSFDRATKDFAKERLANFVKRMIEMGGPRAEISLASKVLHWIAPARVPIFDQYVRKHVGISGSAAWERAYGELVEWEFDAARDCARVR